MKDWLIIISLVFIIVFFIVDDSQSNKILEGTVIDKWTVSKKICYFENFCPNVTHYFVAIDSTYDDIEVPEDKYKTTKVGDLFTCLIGICEVKNELHTRDK